MNLREFQDQTYYDAISRFSKSRFSECGHTPEGEFDHENTCASLHGNGKSESSEQTSDTSDDDEIDKESGLTKRQLREWKERAEKRRAEAKAKTESPEEKKKAKAKAKREEERQMGYKRPKSASEREKPMTERERSIAAQGTRARGEKEIMEEKEARSREHNN